MARSCFFSFQYEPDNWRVSTVRNIGAIDGNKAATDNDWESVTNSGEAAIKRWISSQMRGRSCTVVLVGSGTAGRKWINHEIIESWNAKMGVVGIRIHGLKDRLGNTASLGGNPFDHVTHGPTNKKLSTIVKCYNPAGSTSRERYSWIEKHLSNAVEEAIRIRKDNN